VTLFIACFCAYRMTLVAQKTDGEGFEAVCATGFPTNYLQQPPILVETESEAVTLDSDLIVIIEAWPVLSSAIKAGILAMIRAAKPNP
jgi:transcriptional antiterminator Rof (Rho-off)